MDKAQFMAYEFIWIIAPNCGLLGVHCKSPLHITYKCQTQRGKIETPEYTFARLQIWLQKTCLNISSWQNRIGGALWGKASRHDTVLCAQLFGLVWLLWGVPPGNKKTRVRDRREQNKMIQNRKKLTSDYCSPQWVLVSCTLQTWINFNERGHLIVMGTSEMTHLIQISVLSIPTLGAPQ